MTGARASLPVCEAQPREHSRHITERPSLSAHQAAKPQIQSLLTKRSNMFRKLFKFISIGLLLVSTSVAQQPGQPSVNRLQQIISYLASDALEGRRTGTPGANDAAHYIAGEFSLLGLRPAIQMAGAARTRGEIRARYLQPFPYVSKVELGKNNLLFVTGGRANDAAQLVVGT